MTAETIAKALGGRTAGAAPEGQNSPQPHPAVEGARESQRRLLSQSRFSRHLVASDETARLQVHRIRESVLEAMEWIGVELDLNRNRSNADVIASDRSSVRVFVIRTNEELMIARHADELLAQRGRAVHRVA